MWRELEIEAIRIGLDLNYFWSLNPKQYSKYIQVYNEKLIEKVKQEDEIAHRIGYYVGLAFNDPGNFPTVPFSQSKQDTNKEMTDEDMETIARRNTIMLGGTIL